MSATASDLVVLDRRRFEPLANNAKRAKKVGRVASKSNEWYTLPEYIEAARDVLGAIDLDPASCAAANAVVHATRFYSASDDGLTQPWHGRVWMNPPYAQPLIAQFAEKLAASVTAGTVSAAIVLVTNATERVWFRTLVSVSEAVCFPEGRLRFWRPDKPKPAIATRQGQALLYAGPDVDRFCRRFRELGLIFRTAQKQTERQSGRPRLVDGDSSSRSAARAS